jgi:hypothetical protein
MSLPLAMLRDLLDHLKHLKNPGETVVVSSQGPGQFQIHSTLEEGSKIATFNFNSDDLAKNKQPSDRSNTTKRSKAALNNQDSKDNESKPLKPPKPPDAKKNKPAEKRKPRATILFSGDSSDEEVIHGRSQMEIVARNLKITEDDLEESW